MARSASAYNRTRTQNRRANASSVYGYVDGTAVRKLNTAAVPAVPQRERPQETSIETKQNRERALQMNLPYVLFLTAAAIVTMFVCVNFLKLQANATRLQKEVTVLETALDSAILENNADYNRIMTSVDMDHVKRIALGELGMVYAKKSQIVSYQIDENDYVRQYTEIPAE